MYFSKFLSSSKIKVKTSLLCIRACTLHGLSVFSIEHCIDARSAIMYQREQKEKKANVRSSRLCVTRYRPSGMAFSFSFSRARCGSDREIPSSIRRPIVGQYRDRIDEIVNEPIGDRYAIDDPNR